MKFIAWLVKSFIAWGVIALLVFIVCLMCGNEFSREATWTIWLIVQGISFLANLLSGNLD